MNDAAKDVELIYFPGCPNAEAARANLEAALREVGAPPDWREWNVGDPSTPARAACHGSPTVLVDGRDVTGIGHDVSPGVLACRKQGPPSVSQIAAALTGDTRKGEEGS